MIGGKARVRILRRTDRAVLATFAGKGLRASSGKGLDRQVLDFTAHSGEPGYDPALFDDTLAKVQVDLGAGWVDYGIPYVLRNPSGTVRGDGEGAAKTVQARGVGALALLAELPVLQYDLAAFETATGKKVNRRGPKQIYFGWQHPAFNSASWAAVTVVTGASLADSAPKKGKPDPWGDSARNWIYHSTGTGGLTLLVGGTFTVATARKYLCRASADEEFKVYLFGPGWGGVFLESSAQETGFEDSNENSEVLQPGTYTWCAEMTTINSSGGDGFDAFIGFFATVGTNGNPANVVSRTDETWRAWRQDKDDPRPGLTFGHILRLQLQAAQAWMPGSTSEALTRTFTDVADSEAAAWVAGTERSYPFGVPLTTVIGQAADEIDALVDGAWGLGLWQDRGTDRSASIILSPGSTAASPQENIGGHTWQALSPTATRAIVDTEDGLVVHVATDEGLGAAKCTPRAAHLEAGDLNSVGEGRAFGTRHVSRNKHVNVTPSMDVLGVPGKVPGVNFDWGDTITGRGRYGAAKALRVGSWALRQGDAPPLWWTLEKDEDDT